MTLSNLPVRTLPDTRNIAAVANDRIHISSNVMQEVSLRFGSRKTVSLALYSLAGKFVGEYATSNGTVTISKKDCQPGTYIARWQSAGVGGVQRILLK
jgi:hypothetical protein